MTEDDKLKRKVERQAHRMKRAEKDRPTLLAQTSYITTLGLVFIMPVVAGAYLGQWLDLHMAGYSVRWTLGFLFLGAVIGGMNVYYLVRKRS